MLKLFCLLLAVTAFGKSRAALFPEDNVRSFTVDYEHNTFLKDGKPYRYIAGGFHYFRVPHQYWEDRIAKMAAAGLDAIQTYVAWNIHEPQEGVFDFEGQNDLIKFIQLAQKYNLYVILRPGPYICAEWEYGGLPAWLLSTKETVNIRRMDFRYIQAVNRWFSKLLPLVKPYLYVSGGPILMVQVENEYGSFHVCDHNYMDYLAKFMENYLGPETLLFSTDGSSMGLLQCGTTKKAFATVDFGTPKNVSSAFQPMRDFNNNKGPLVNSELYVGWLDSWGEGHHYVSTKRIINTLEQMDALNASYNMYMFLGGTTFGYMNGANHPRYHQPTSYDYDAPLNEAGDVTEKYMAIRDLISKSKPNLPPVPKNSEKKAYGDISLKKIGNILELLDVASTRSVKTLHPIPMEHINHYYGFILYRHVVKENSGNCLLKVPGLRDRGHVLLDGQSVGVLESTLTTSLIISAKKGQVLDILVENMGRFNYGRALEHNSKGIIEKVSLGDKNLTDWTMHPIDLDNFFKKEVASDVKIDSLKFRPGGYLSSKAPLLEAPSIYMGTFKTPEHEVTKDTFLDMCGWTWGVVYVNGHNLGRFRPKYGPQVTLYVPAVYLKPHPEKNVVMVFEMENVQPTGPAKAKVVSTDKPELNSNCFQYSK